VGSCPCCYLEADWPRLEHATFLTASERPTVKPHSCRSNFKVTEGNVLKWSAWTSDHKCALSSVNSARVTYRFATTREIRGLIVIRVTEDTVAKNGPRFKMGNNKFPCDI